MSNQDEDIEEAVIDGEELSDMDEGADAITENGEGAVDTENTDSAENTENPENTNQ